MAEVSLDIQIAYQHLSTPNDKEFTQWVNLILSNQPENLELTIRVVNNQESQLLNYQYRNKDKPTNVLSFPFEVPEGIELNLLGDLVICADVVAEEAKQQNKNIKSHWAHMVLHGCLHLLGYDHIEDREAEEMEAIEIKLMKTLGFDNPYLEI